MKKWAIVLGMLACLMLAMVSAAQADYVLPAEAAELDLAPDVILEPEDPPYNLGGWRSGNTVCFPINVESAAYHEVILRYSREGDFPIDIWVNTSSGEMLVDGLLATGAWSHYTEQSIGYLWITPEDEYLYIEDEDPVEDLIYVMNLREVVLRLPGEEAAAEEMPEELPEEYTYSVQDVSDYRGIWYSDTVHKLRLEITRGSATLNGELSVSSYSYTVEPDGLAFSEGMIRLLEDGGLEMDGQEGAFYRAGEGRIPASPYAAYLGSWENETADVSYEIQDGLYMQYDGSGFGAGGLSIEEGTLYIDSAKATLISDNSMTVEGYEGEFLRVGTNEGGAQAAEPVYLACASPRPIPKAAEPEDAFIYIEPITGTRVALPGIFAGAAHSSFADTYGVHQIFQVELDGALTVDVIVEERWLENMYGVLKAGASFTDRYDILWLSEHSMLTYSEASSFDERTYAYRWLYLLEDGSVLKVECSANRQELLAYGEQISVSFGLRADAASIPLKSSIRVETDSWIAGAWHEEQEDIWLYAPDGALFALYDGEGELLACGEYDAFWDEMKMAQGDESVYYDAAQDGFEIGGSGEPFYRAELPALDWAGMEPLRATFAEQ